MKHLFSAIISSLGGRIKEGLLLLALFPLTLWAYDFQSGNLYYELTSDTTAMVTSKSASSPYNDGVTITSAIIPSSVSYGGKTFAVTAIDDYAFYKCTSLASVTIPTTVTSIGYNAFYGTSLYNNSAKWENDVLYIGDCLIKAKTTLSGSYTIKSNTRLIAENAFYECTSLTSITIPENVQLIGRSCFHYCESLAKVVWNAKRCTEFYKSGNAGNYLFSNTPVTSFVFGEGVEHIPGSICYGLEILTSVTIPANVTSIGDHAFDGCYMLNSVVLGNNVTTIGRSAFSYCSSLASITIPNSVTDIGSSAFYKCSSLTSITWNAKNYANISSSSSSPFYHIRSQIASFKFGDNVQTIPNYLCYEMDKLQSISIPNNVTTIGNSAFSGCSSLSSVALSNNVRTIGDYTFQNCSSLSTITIPESVTYVGKYAFSGCSSLTTITYGNSSVTSIGDYAFQNCSSLPSITIPENVTKISNTVFSGCSSLTSITWNAKNYANISSSSSSPFYNIRSQIASFKFGDKVQSIPDYLCYGMDKLPSISIPNNVTTIGNSAFSGCSSLSTVALGNSVTSIGDYTFQNCSSLSSITIPENITYVGKYAFNGCSSLTVVMWNAKNCEIVATGSPYAQTTPFYGVRSQITSFTFGDGVVNIPNWLCYEMEKLTSIVIPYCVTNVGYGTFRRCSSITSVVWNAKIAEDYQSKNYAPFENSPIYNFVFGDGVQHIPAFLCYNLSSLPTITIPENITTIGNNAFGQCVGLTSVEWNPVTCIGYWDTEYAYPIFTGCKNVESFVFGDNVQEIPKYLCYQMSKITSLALPKSLNTIGFRAFKECSSLTAITIPESVKTIDGSAFDACTSLNKTNYTSDVASWCNIKFANTAANPINYSHNFYINNQEIKDLVIPGNTGDVKFGVFFNCTSLSSITILDGVTNISKSAFNGCSSVSKLVLGESLVNIGDYAFSKCSSLSSLVLPASVESIGDSTFYNCTSLSSITAHAENPSSVGNNAFYGVKKTIPVYVPCENVEAYKSADGWKAFTNIQEPLPQFVISISSRSNEMGEARVDRNTYCEGTQISATANDGYLFKQWSDGNTDNPRTLVLTQDTSLTAMFEQVLNIDSTYQIYYTSSDGNIITPKSLDAFGANLLSNIYQDSIGIITFDGVVTSIGDYTFEGSPLTSIIIPNGVTNIGNAAFTNCSSLISIKVEKGNAIYDSREDCNAIIQTATNTLIVGCQNTIIPNSVVQIDNSAFEGCSSLTNITIPNGVTSIGSYAFQNCSSLESIEIPNSMKYIGGKSAFAACTSLKSVLLPDSLLEIGPGAFGGCSSLESINIPNGIKTIEASTFFGCSSLTSIVIPNSVTRIWDSAFEGCSSLLSVEIGESVTTIENRAFLGCYSINTIYCYPVAPPEILFLSTFENCKATVYVPCQAVDAYKAAYGWRIFADSIQEPLLAYTISVSSQSNEMGEAKVVKNTYCEGAQISATANEGYLFKQWSDGNTDNPRTLLLTQDISLTAIFEQVLNIDSTYQIYYTSSDGNIVTPYKTDNFGANIISNTYENGQGVITFDAPLKLIGNSAFENCTSLTSIIIPDSVISIDGYAFKGCSSLTSVHIPKGVKQIGGKLAFAGCSSLKSIVLPNSIMEIGPGAFMGCSALTSVVLPDNITSIEESTFAQCSSIISVTLGNNIKRIWEDVFADCTSLTTITLPANLEHVMDRAFKNCTSTTSITSLAITPPEVWSMSAFDNVNKTIPVYVPCGSVDAYKSAYAWSVFTNIQEPLSEYSLVVNTQNSLMGSAQVEKNTACEAARISATANDGYLFKQWSDGNTDNPRTLVLTQDTMLTAIFMAQLPIYKTFYDTICDHTRYLDTITNSFKYISSEDPSSLIWSDTIFSDIQDTIYTFIITPIVDPIAMTDSLLATIPHALPILIQGEKPNVDASVAAIKAYYAANDTKTTSDVVEVSWYNVDTIIPCDATTFSMYLHVYTVCEDDNPNHFPEPGNPGKLPEFIFNVEKRAVSTTEFNETICQGGAYLWPVNGQSYTQTGMYYDTLRTTNGCDEEIRILYLTVKNAEPVELYEEACDSYAWNGEVYTESGDYTYRATASNGCDSVVTLHLTINTSKTFEETIVACDSYTWNGQVYTESGDYTYRTTASNGCDSIVTLHLTINTSKTFEETVVACDSYTWNGEIYTESGDYTYRTTASNGCDSVVTLHLTINKSAVAEMEYATICNGETYTWNGAVYNQAGDYSVTLNTAAGCDSIVSLKLTILPAMQTETQNVELCTSDLPYSWYGQTLTEAGTYTYIEQYAGYACDSVEHVLNLQVHTLALPSSISLPIAVCGSSIDVSAATADIEAFIASEPTYASNATVTWQQQQAGVWTALSTQPLDGGQGEVIVRYMIISDCGVLESPEIVVPVEMPTPENSKDLDGVKSVSKYNNRIFLFHLNDFVKKYGWAPKPEQVIWYKVVGEIDTYGAPGNDMVVGIGHNYNLPDGSVIKGDYYALVIQDSPNNDGCTSVYRTVLLTATQDENNSPALVPNVVQPNAQLSLQNLDPTKVHEVRVYDTSGDCIATYMAEHVSEFLFNANHVAGYYLVDVINENNKITLRYVVK